MEGEGPPRQRSTRKVTQTKSGRTIKHKDRVSLVKKQAEARRMPDDERNKGAWSTDADGAQVGDPPAGWSNGNDIRDASPPVRQVAGPKLKRKNTARVVVRKHLDTGMVTYDKATHCETSSPSSFRRALVSHRTHCISHPYARNLILVERSAILWQAICT